MYRAALALGTANQLTNILRDVGEDVNQRNRIYLPMEELEQFKISEKEVSERGAGPRAPAAPFLGLCAAAGGHATPRGNRNSAPSWQRGMHAC